jgi:2-polyprenyl-3-methyl-5-hydroxy-6-metoxy-1,4-benzoquinol methylase
MDLKERDALGEKADDHWYYVAKAHLISYMFSTPHQTVLDVGAGLGWFSEWLITHGHANNAICVDPGYESDTQKILENGGRIDFVKSITDSDADLVLLMDVLEHVDDDIGLLSEYYEKAPVGAEFIVTVPAFQFLWSPHDDYLEHRRRYTRASLNRLITIIGAKPIAVHYYFGIIFPAVVLFRILTKYRKSDRSDMRGHSKILNNFLKKVCLLELPLSRFNVFGGLSVVARFKKEQ